MMETEKGLATKLPQQPIQVESAFWLCSNGLFLVLNNQPAKNARKDQATGDWVFDS
jgi:hypothetical protein